MNLQKLSGWRRYKAVVTLIMLLALSSWLEAFNVEKVSAARDGFSLTCDSVTFSGDHWTASGTWGVIDYIGVGEAYDVALFSSVDQILDGSSKDLPDTVSGIVGEYGGKEHKADIEGEWTNQFTHASAPMEMYAKLYHGQIGGEESSDTIQCPIVQPSCNDGIDNDEVADGLIDYPADPGCSGITDTDEYDVPQPVNTVPVITLNGPSIVSIPVGGQYVDAGASAFDAEDGDVSGAIQVEGAVLNTAVPSTFVITYRVRDSMEGTAQVTRTVIIVAEESNSDVEEDHESTTTSSTVTLAVRVMNGSERTSLGMDPHDFSITVTQQGTTSQLSGNEEYEVKLLPGEYRIEGSVYEGYSSTSISSECSGLHVEGKRATCVITYEQDRYHITGTVWNDADADGSMGHNEEALAGWVVHAMNGYDVISTTTDQDGAYVLDVPRGTWTVYGEIKEGWTSALEQQDSFTVSLPEDLEMAGEPERNIFARLFHAFIPTAHAALLGTISGVNLGHKAIVEVNSVTSPLRGNGIHISLSEALQEFDLSTTEEAEKELEDMSIEDEDLAVDIVSLTEKRILPSGEVLGVATDILPVGAPRTGGGGTAPQLIGTISVLLSLLFFILTRRVASGGGNCICRHHMY